MCLGAITRQTSHWSRTTRRAYISGLHKINILSPYFAAIFILADVQEREIVSLADHLPRRRIRIHTSLGKTGNHIENTPYSGSNAPAPQAHRTYVK
jgi:hypothetical protein